MKLYWLNKIVAPLLLITFWKLLLLFRLPTFQDVQSNRWYYVDNKVARDKVGNCLRDAIKQRTHCGGFVLDSFPDCSDQKSPTSSKSKRQSPDKTPSESVMCTSSYHHNTIQGNLIQPISPTDDKFSKHWVGRIEQNGKTTEIWMGDESGMIGNPAKILPPFNASISISTSTTSSGSVPAWDAMDLEPRPLGSVVPHIAL